jgi:hypothetical protein
MPIPNKFDAKIADLSNLGEGVIVQLRCALYAVGCADKGYRKKLRASLKEKLQTFADGVMEAADEIGDQ